MMVGDQTHPIENASGTSLLQLQCAVEHSHEEGQLPKDNIRRHFF